MDMAGGNGQWEMARVVSVDGSMAEQCTRWQWKGTEKAGEMLRLGMRRNTVAACHRTRYNTSAAQKDLGNAHAVALTNNPSYPAGTMNIGDPAADLAGTACREKNNREGRYSGLLLTVLNEELQHLRLRLTPGT